MGISKCKINTTTQKIQNLRHEPFLYRIKSSNYICDRLISGEGKEADAKQGARDFMESEYTWMASEKPKTEEPTQDTSDTLPDKGVTKTKRVGSEGQSKKENVVML